MITIFSMYITHLHGSGCNSYQGHVNDSGEFWRVLGHPCVRCHWKCDIVDTFTHHFCANGHGGTIGPSFPYIRRVWRRHSPQCNIIVLSLVYCWLYFALHSTQRSTPLTKVSLDLVCCALCCATGYGPCQRDLVSARRVEHRRPLNTLYRCSWLLTRTSLAVGNGSNVDLKSIIWLASLCEDERMVYDGRTPTQGVAIAE